MSKIEADWLDAAFTRRVVDALGTNSVKFVGGAVRDTLLGKVVEDIDAATIHLPEKTMQLLSEADIKVIPTGLQHGTVTAVGDGTSIEITTLRIDVETDGRHAEVAFTDSWLVDANRRDFTFNAIYAAPDGTLFDPFDGQTDLSEGRVVFIGEAEERIKEDALRILRFFRFFAINGEGAADGSAVTACGKLRGLLDGLSVERIRTELLKLLAAEDPMPALDLMDENGIFEALGVDGLSTKILEQFIKNENQVEASQTALVRAFILFKPIRRAKELVRWLKMSGKQAKILRAVEAALEGRFPKTSAEHRRFIYLHGGYAAEVAAVQNANLHARNLLETIETWPVPLFPVMGRDLLAMGRRASPELGETLAALKTDWVESDFCLTKAQLLASL